jgi:hypothetical protein
MGVQSPTVHTIIVQWNVIAIHPIFCRVLIFAMNPPNVLLT